MRFFRKHKKLVFFLVFIVIAGFVAVNYFWKREKVEYITAKVEKGTLNRTVSVTGSVMSDIVTDLRFEINGKLEKINFQEGDRVRAGEIIAELSANDEKIQLEEAKAALEAAQANLALKKAGATIEDIKVAKTNVEAAEVALKIAKTNLENIKESGTEDIREAELRVKNSLVALTAAEADLKNSEENLENVIQESQQAVDNAYDSLKVTMEKNLLKIFELLTDIDEIVGVDDPDVNDSFESSLGILKSTTLDEAELAYSVAKTDFKKADEEFSLLADQSSLEKIKEVADILNQALYSLDNAFLKTRILLNNSAVSKNLTETMLDNFKSTVDLGRISVNTEIKNLQSKKQALISAELSKKSKVDSAKAAYDTVKNNLDKAQTAKTIAEQNLSKIKVKVENAIKNAQLEIEAKEKALETAKASLNLKQAPPRQVDIASLEAQVAKAQAALALAEKNLEKTVLRAPSDGIIVSINGDIGENISLSQIFAVMISPQLIIEADVSETDINKIKLGQKVTITFDAFGEDEKFFGEVFFIDPAETNISDVIYYKIKVALDDRKGREIRSGMTANLDILTAKKNNVLFIPQRAIIEKGEDKIVRVLTKNKIREARVKTGIRGDNGMVEIVSGLKKGQDIVISVKSK